MSVKKLPKMDKRLTNIGLNVFNLETLETQNSDGLDFHDVSVWSIKKALIAAYELGQRSK